MTMKRWLMPGLFMFLLAVSGTAYACHEGGGAHAMGHSKLQLPEEKRALLHDAMKKSFENDKASFEQMKALHHKMHDILAAGSFDKKAFMNTASQMQKLHERITRDRLAAFASVADRLSPEEREAVARHIAAHHHGMHGHHHAHDGENRGSGHETTPASHDEYPYPPYGAR